MSAPISYIVIIIFKVCEYNQFKYKNQYLITSQHIPTQNSFPGFDLSEISHTLKARGACDEETCVVA
jgi:hypothetical protein